MGYLHGNTDLWIQVNTDKPVSLLGGINTDVELEAVFNIGMQLYSY